MLLWREAAGWLFRPQRSPSWEQSLSFQLLLLVNGQTGWPPCPSAHPCHSDAGPGQPFLPSSAECQAAQPRLSRR